MKVGVVKKSQTNLDNWFGENYLNQIINRNTPMPEEPAPASYQSRLHIPEGDDYAENAHLIDPYLLPYLPPLQEPEQTEYPPTDLSDPQRNPEHIFHMERLLDDSKFKFPLSENVPTEASDNAKAYGFGGVTSAQKDIYDYLRSQSPYEETEKNNDWLNYLNSMYKPGGFNPVDTPGDTLDKEKMHMMPDSFLDLMYPQSKLPEYDWGFQSERWLDDDGNPIPGAIPPVNALRLTDANAVRRMLQTRGGLVPKDTSFRGFEQNLSSHYYPFETSSEHPAKGKGFFITSPDIKNVREAVTPHQSDPIPVGIRGFRHDTGTGKTQSRPIKGQHERVTEALVGEHIPQEKLVIPRVGNRMLNERGYKNANSSQLMIARLLREGVTPDEIASMYPQLKAYYDKVREIDSKNTHLDLQDKLSLGLDRSGPLRTLRNDLGSATNDPQNALKDISNDLKQQLESNDLIMRPYTEPIGRERGGDDMFGVKDNLQFLDLLNRINPPNLPEFYEGIVDDKTGMPIIGGEPMSMSTLTQNPDLIPEIAKYYEELERLNKVTTPPSWGNRLAQLEDLSEAQKEAYRNFLQRYF